MLTKENLRRDQLLSVELIKKNKRLAIWSKMGLGKTIVTLTAIDELHWELEVNRVLIVAPLRVAFETWPFETAKWQHTQDLRPVIISRNFELSRYDNLINIINVEMLPKLITYYDDVLPYDMLVIDESSLFKAHDRKRFNSLKGCIASIDRVVELTGTPAPNGYLQIWSQMYLLDGGIRLSKYITHFRDRFFLPKFSGFGYDLKPHADVEIEKLIQDIVFKVDPDVVELPPVIENEIRLTMSPPVKNIYKTLRKERILELSTGDTLIFKHYLALMRKLLQLANGFIYVNKNMDVEEFHDLKIKEVKQIVDDAQGDPIIIVYNFKHDLKKLQEAFPYASTPKTPNFLEKWNNKEISVFLTHPASIGHGLNMQFGGHIIVWYSLTESLELFQQLNARLHRNGQDHTVFVHYLITKSTDDERVLNYLRKKDVTQQKLLQSIISSV